MKKVLQLCQRSTQMILKAKKIKVDFKPTPDFELVGIVASTREFKVAWYLNKALDIQLSKEEDIKIEFAKKPALLILNYQYRTPHTVIELLCNKLLSTTAQKHLLPELKQFDYLLKIHDQTDEFSFSSISQILQEISVIEYMVKLNFDDLKSKENLLY